MAIKILVCLLVVFVSCVLSVPHTRVEEDADEPVCGQDDLYFPHPDCTKYYQCVNFVPTERLCSGGGTLYWNPMEVVCDFPINVPECQGGTRPPVDDTTPGMTTTKATTVREEPTTTKPEVPTTEEPEGPTEEPVEPTAEPDKPTTKVTDEPMTTTEFDDGTTTPRPFCRPGQYYNLAIPGNCTAYIVCVFGDQTTEVCQPGLKFDPVLLRCALEENVECYEPTTTTTEAPICPEPGHYKKPYPGSCNLYYVCVDHRHIISDCGHGLVFDEYLLDCVRQENSNCTVPTTKTPEPEPTEESETDEPTTTKRPERCDPNKNHYIPFENDNTCTQYIHCNFGLPIFHTCPEGMLFDPAEEKCVRAENYECPTVVTTHAPTEAATEKLTTVVTDAPPNPTTISPPNPTTISPPTPNPNPTTERDLFPCSDDAYKYFPHYESCHLFYLCINGEFRGIHTCGDSHWFDSEFQGCVVPELSDCPFGLE